MSSAAYIEMASEWAKDIVWREARGPGDIEPAMHRVASKHKVPFSVLWSLRYRKPKSIDLGVSIRLAIAFLSYSNHRRHFEHDQSGTSASTRFGETILRAASALASAGASLAGASAETLNERGGE